MNAVDATDREAQTDNGVPASLLTIILDTNPHAWTLLASDLPLSKVVANLLVFINAHLAISNANRVAVIASHVQRAQWLYPSPALPTPAEDRGTNGNAPDDPNKYRPFAQVEHTLNRNIRALMASTSPSDLKDIAATMMAGALTMALAYIRKATLSAGPSSTTASSGAAGAAVGSFTDPNSTSSQNTSQGLTSRILIVSVSGDLSHQYIPMMNAIFACQRLHCPIDILKLAGDTVFLQQAADATGGIYTSLLPASKPADDDSIEQRKTAGILQYLLLAYLPDPSARALLNSPGESHGVDFRAACFCHRRVVDVGYVCSVCLSIFCDPGVLADADGTTCLTCGTALRVAGFGVAPVVVGGGAGQKRKKKGTKGARDGTPAGGSSAVATPG